MTEPQKTTSFARPFLRSALPALILSVLSTVAFYVALGPTTGFFFGAVVLATLLTPPLALADASPVRQLIVASAVADGIALACVVALADPSVALADWLRFYVLLLAYVTALWGLAALLVRLRVAPLFASALVTVAALAWLAWPIWLSPWLAGRPRLVGALTTCHPLLALDGALRHLGPPWSERHLMYNFLSVLNQDVPYELPRAVWPAVALHAGIGVAALAVTALWRRVAPQAASQPPPAPGPH
jgi:hypothetical protein